MSSVYGHEFYICRNHQDALCANKCYAKCSIRLRAIKVERAQFLVIAIMLYNLESL